MKKKHTKDNILCIVAFVCVVICIITARSIKSNDVQEIVLFSLGAAYLAVFIGVNRKLFFK